MNFLSRFSVHRRKQFCVLLLGLSVFVFYLLFSLLISYVFSVIGFSVVLSSYLSDFLMILLFGYFYYRLAASFDHRVNFSRFSGYGWALLLFLFISFYVFSQSMGALVETWFPSSYMGVYQNMEGSDLILYLVLSITIAPLAEELLFRGFLYQMLREKFSIPVCLFISSSLFAFIHGTTGHIPVTVGLTLFLCLLLELTGKLRYAIGFHIFYNVLGLAYITRVSFTYLQIIVCYFCILFLLVFAYFHIDRLRHLFSVGGIPPIESYLDSKRK